MRLAVRRLTPEAQLPERSHHDDAGYDLCAIEGCVLEPGARVAVGTGLALELPSRCAGLVVPRSGLALQHGIALANAPGLIDAGYRGELQVALINTDRERAFTIEAGDRIAQLVVVRVEAPDVVEVDALAESARGADGFGSSGR